MRLRGMIFDMDGTVSNTLPVCIGAFQQVFHRHLGRAYSDGEILAMFGPNEEGMIGRLIPEDYEVALEEFLTEYERRLDGREIVFPGLERAFDLLRERGIRLGVVTGKGPASLAITLRRAGLEATFDVVEAGSPARGVKPDAMRRVLARWGMPPGEVAYVGDSPSDMADAIQVGLIPLGAAWAATSAVQDPDCCGAEITFESVERFVEWIERET